MKLFIPAALVAAMSAIAVQGQYYRHPACWYKAPCSDPKGHGPDNGPAFDNCT